MSEDYKPVIHRVREFLKFSHSRHGFTSRTLYLRTKHVLQKDFLEASFSIVRTYLGNEKHYAGL